MSLFRLFGVAVVLLLSAPASAQTLEPLTADTVKGFLVSLQDIEEVGNKYEVMELMNPNTSVDTAMARAAAPFTAVIAQMQGHQAYGEMVAAIERHGFSDIQQWAATGDRVLKAFAANRMAAQMPQIDEQMKQAVEQIENSGMSAAQKEAMLQMMQSSRQIMGLYDDVSPADKAAVLPFMSEIEALGRQ